MGVDSWENHQQGIFQQSMFDYHRVSLHELGLFLFTPINLHFFPSGDPSENPAESAESAEKEEELSPALETLQLIQRILSHP